MQSHQELGELINQAQVNVIYLWAVFKYNRSKALSDLCRCAELQGTKNGEFMNVCASQTHGEAMYLLWFSTQLEIQCLYFNHHYLILFHIFFLSANYTVFTV